MGSPKSGSRLGTRFGPYQLQSVIGVGGMGEVYRAYDTARERMVAIKLLRPEMAADHSFQQRFRRESKVAARLQEPHVIPVHDFGEIDGVLYIDMRLVEGDSLASLLRHVGALAPGRAVSIVRQVAGRSVILTRNADGDLRGVEEIDRVLAQLGADDIGVTASVQVHVRIFGERRQRHHVIVDDGAGGLAMHGRDRLASGGHHHIEADHQIGAAGADTEKLQFLGRGSAAGQGHAGNCELFFLGRENVESHPVHRSFDG